MIFGYARVSTAEQEAGLWSQVHDLQTSFTVGVGQPGCVVFREKASAVGERPVLEKILDDIKRGDTLVVTKLDRLARSVAHLGQIAEHLEKRGASLRILNISMDTATPTGKFMLNVLGSVAQFERELMLERQKEGIEVAKKKGKYKGRKAGVDAEAVKDAFDRRVAKGKSRPQAVAEVAESYRISERQVYRHLAK
jgi:DNA invertase Pin-like site-specific DNA recombinase